MKDLILNLEAIKAICKDLHYGASGNQFYALHLLADRIADPIPAFIDSIKEVCFSEMSQTRRHPQKSQAHFPR